MEKINCFINGNNYTFDKGTTLLGISKQVNTGLKDDCLVLTGSDSDITIQTTINEDIEIM